MVTNLDCTLTAGGRPAGGCSGLEGNSKLIHYVCHSLASSRGDATTDISRKLSNLEGGGPTL